MTFAELIGCHKNNESTKLFEAERGIEHLPASEHLEARQADLQADC